MQFLTESAQRCRVTALTAALPLAPLLLLDWLLLCCRCFHCDHDARALPAPEDFCFLQQTPGQTADQIEPSKSEVNTAVVSRTFSCFATSR